MNQLHKDEFITRMKALSEEEKRLAVKEMPERMLWDELYRRSMEKDKTIKGIKKTMRMC